MRKTWIIRRLANEPKRYVVYAGIDMINISVNEKKKKIQLPQLEELLHMVSMKFECKRKKAQWKSSMLNVV